MPNKDYLLPADLSDVKGWNNRSYEATIQAKFSHPKQYEILRLLESGRPEEELYNMKTDPYQLVNLANDASYNTKKWS
ncbi:hypothetical protein [Algibacter sp. L3A6]|uniref:hypothetical protein n=1 Tax=Algibacter sp. L3A6 TaxID=2686366 RepID=UPI0018EF0A62|nr:hypothetical protein [Algibacter sp. L3A6]